MAATTIAADFVITAGSDAPVAYRNSDLFVESASKRGTGRCDPQLMALTAWFAEAASRSGVSLSADELRVFHTGRRLKTDASDERAKEAAAAAAQLPSSLRALAYHINAFGVRMAGPRRTMCAGVSIRAFFAFHAQMPNIGASKNGRQSQMRMGIMDLEEEEQAAEEPPARRKQKIVR